MLKTRLPLRPVSGAGDRDRAAGGQPGQPPAGGRCQASAASAAWRLRDGSCHGGRRDLGQQEAGARCEIASLPGSLGPRRKLGGH